MKIYRDYEENENSFQDNNSNYLFLPSCRNAIPKYIDSHPYRIPGGDEKMNQCHEYKTKSKERIHKTKRMDRNKLSINILQLLLRQIFKLKNEYEKRNTTETLFPYRDKERKTDVDMVLKCFRDLYLILMQITRKNFDSQLDYLPELFRNTEDQFLVNKRVVCQNTILELLKAKDVELKSRMYIDTTENTEEIVFINQRKPIGDISNSAGAYHHISRNGLSFLLIEILNKENYENFLSVMRHVVCSCNVSIHQDTSTYKALQRSVLCSTPELWRIESGYQSNFDTDLCQLDSSDERPDKRITNNRKYPSLRNSSNCITNNTPKERHRYEENMSQIISCLKAIESLTKDMPKVLLKRVLEMK